MPARPLWLCVHEAERHTGGEKKLQKKTPGKTEERTHYSTI